MPAGEPTAVGKIQAVRFRVRAQKGRLNRSKGLSLDTRVYTRIGILKFHSSRMALEFRQLELILPVSADWCWHSTASALACCRLSTRMATRPTLGPTRPKFSDALSESRDRYKLP